MAGLDERLAELGTGSVALSLLLALLVGLRHATDPDHLTAVATLVLSDSRDGRSRAARVGAAWGSGHALTLLLAGLPVVLAGRLLPEPVQRGLEVAVGLLIVALAARLLVRWRRGYLHLHPHRHGPVWHAHPHVHERAPATGHPAGHAHRHEEALGRTPLGAFGIGMLHGLGGSAGAGVLLAGSVEGAAAAVALAVFAVGTALSMTLVSVVFVAALSRTRLPERVGAAIPAFGLAGLVFGLWYALAAVETVPYAL